MASESPLARPSSLAAPPASRSCSAAASGYWFETYDSGILISSASFAAYRWQAAWTAWAWAAGASCPSSIASAWPTSIPSWPATRPPAPRTRTCPSDARRSPRRRTAARASGRSSRDRQSRQPASPAKKGPQSPGQRLRLDLQVLDPESLRLEAVQQAVGVGVSARGPHHERGVGRPGRRGSRQLVISNDCGSHLCIRASSLRASISIGAPESAGAVP